jgi:hypothetical protein
MVWRREHRIVVIRMGGMIMAVMIMVMMRMIMMALGMSPMRSALIDRVGRFMGRVNHAVLASADWQECSVSRVT